MYTIGELAAIAAIVIYCRFKVDHPAVILAAGLFLYHILPTAIGELLGFYPEDLRFIHELNILAIAGVVGGVVLGVVSGKYLASEWIPDEGSVDRKFVYFVVVAIIMVGAGHHLWLFSTGIGSKTEWILQSGASVVFVYSIFVTLAVLLIAMRWCRGGNAIGLVVALGVFAAIPMLTVGERDVLFKYVVAVALLGFMWKKFGRRQVFGLGLALIVFMPISGGLKNIALGGGGSGEIWGEDDILVEVFRGEFRAPVRNLATLNQNRERPGVLGPKVFLWDLGRTFVPSQIWKVQNVQGWYAQKYYPGRKALGYGRGFSLAGEGYVAFGKAGVLFVFLVLGLMTGAMYRMVQGKTLGLVAYSLWAPLAIFSIRASLSMVLSPFVKHVILPLSALIVITAVVRMALRREHTEEV